jgi:hypothetical protein
MAETGKLGTADSLLASVQLAFAAAEATPPEITTQDGRLGGELGSTILALAEVVGPLTFNLSAESGLALAQTADPAPTFAAHSSPHWTIGGQGSRLGAMEPAFTGAEASLPTPTVQTGRFGATLGSTVLGLDGVVGSQVTHLSAESVLAVAQTVDPAPTFVAHLARRWVLGGQDSGLGSAQLAYAGAEEPRPATGDRTGKLGTANSFLAGMRLALGEAEGGGGATIVYGTALTALALSSDAGVAVVRGRTTSDALALTDSASATAVRSVNAASELTLVASAASAAVRDVAANDALDLVDAAIGAAVFTVVAESAADLTVTAETLTVRTLAAADALELTDEAARTALLAINADSAIEPAAASAAAAAVRAVVAANALDLVDEAARTSRTIWTLPVESAISLGSTLDVGLTLGLDVAHSLDLIDLAGHSILRTLDAQSALSPTTAADAVVVRAVGGSDTITVTDAAASHKVVTSAVESAILLGSAASVSVVRAVSATSALDVTDAAAGGMWVSADVEVWDWLPIWDWAEVAVARGVAATSAIALSQEAPVSRPWYVSAESPVQLATQEYDPQLNEMVTRLDGLQDAASVARPLVAAASQAIPLGQSASAVRVKPTAIEVSAESVLELLGEIRPNQTGDTGNWLSFSQTAAVDKCKTTKSTLALSGQATAARSGPRRAASALDLRQAATFSIVFAGVRQQYHPFVGEGAPGAPTPPPVTVGPPEHTALPFRLFYPASGSVTDSVTLRAPNLGNKDRLSFNRILRETRGGTLVVFADPLWPKIQTLVLTFSGLSATQSQQLLTFLETHLGEEIGLLDWEGRCWKGVVMTPTDPVVQDGRNSYSASLEFEGELLPA